MKFKIQDLITPDQLQNKPAWIKIDYQNLENIEVHFAGQFADVIGLGADIYCALVEEVIDKTLMDNLIEDECAILKENYFDETAMMAKLHFAIDEESNISAKMEGKTLPLAAAYFEFLHEVTEHYNISLDEYFKHIQKNYKKWSKLDKKRVFQEGITHGQ